MATAGRTTQGASSRAIENRCYGREVTLSTGDEITSLEIWVNPDTGAHNIQAAIYDTSGNRLALGTNTSVATGASQASLPISYTVAGTTTLVIAAVSENNPGGCIAYYDAGGATSYYDADASTGSPPPATWTGIGTDNTTDDSSIAITYTPVAGSVTKTPAQAVLTINVLAPTTNAFTYVAIQDTLISESGQAVANAANIRLMVWYNGQAIGAPDYSANGQTSNASGSISWSVTPGTLANGQAIFYVAQDSISYSNYTCGRVVPTYG